MKIAPRHLCLLILPFYAAVARAQTVEPPPAPPPLPAQSAEPPALPAAAPAPLSSPRGVVDQRPSATSPDPHSTRDDSASKDSEPKRRPRRWDAVRAAALGDGNTLNGPSGILRVIAASSGEAGTLRVSVSESYFAGTRFLCPNCETPNGAVVTRGDSVRVSSQRLQLSVTPFDFLEAHASLRFRQASNNRNEPRVTQISDDVWFGAKAFTPRKRGRLVGIGGGVNLGLLSQASSVGVGAASVYLHVEGTLDLTERAPKASAIPLRAHLNLAYLFDGSGTLANDIESKRSATLGSPQRITRMERFGFDINRIDSVRLGIGVEGVLPYVRPFAEWSVDIAANRQGFTCRRRSLSAGDQCLVNDHGFAAMPSRLTLGARGYPWVASWAEGLSVLAAVDIGTGGTSSFVEELTPELPWNVHVGLGYAFDTRPRVETTVREKAVRVQAPQAPEQYVEGTVLDAKTGAPVPEVGVTFKDPEGPGMLTDASGRFRSVNLRPGLYTFVVTRPGYGASECSATLFELDASPKPAREEARGSSVPARVPEGHSGPRVTQVKCEIAALPTTGRVDGVIRDSENTQYVAAAMVSARDVRGRSLSIQTNDQGAFRFDNVPAGALRLQIEAEGYLPTAVELELQPRASANVQLSLHKRPKTPSVLVTKSELRLKKQVHFLHDSSEILPDSQELIEEIAEALRSHPEILGIEIQGHTDNSGTPEHNQVLSEQRSNAVRNALLLLGIEPNRLSARGYGQEKPLVANSSAANRAKNRRVQLMIQ